MDLCNIAKSCTYYNLIIIHTQKKEKKKRKRKQTNKQTTKKSNIVPYILTCIS